MVKNLGACLEVLFTRDIVVVPVHYNFPATQLIRSSSTKSCEISAINGAGDNQILTLLNIKTDLNYESRILFQLLLHSVSSSRFVIRIITY